MAATTMERAQLERFARTRDPELRRNLIEHYLPLAYSVARRFVSADRAREDLNQVAALALVHAVDRFDPAHGTEFTTFAVPTITGEIRRHLRDHEWTVRPPRRLYELLTRIKRATRDFEQREQRAPTLAELAEATGCSEEELVEASLATRSRHVLSLQAPVGSEGEATLGDMLPASDDELARADHRLLVQDELRRLPVRSRRVLVMRYVGDLTQNEIGRHLGISQMQVSRTLREALDTLGSASA